MLSKERGQYFQEQYDKLEYKFANQELNNKCNQLQSNWNSLRKFVEELYNKEGSWASCGARYVLDKMNELESGDNE